MLFGSISVFRVPHQRCQIGVGVWAPLDLRQRCPQKFKGGWQMRTILTKALIALAITTVAAFGADNTLGTWKLDVAKSKYTPAPMPIKSLTVTREASDGGVKVTITGEQADGTAINATYTIKYDGKGVQVTGNSPYDTIAAVSYTHLRAHETRHDLVCR